MQSGLFQSQMFVYKSSIFLSFITLSLSLHSLLNKKENEVASVVNIFLVVYSRYLFILTTTKFSLICFPSFLSALLCLPDPRSSYPLLLVFDLCLNLLIRSCVWNCAFFSVYSLFTCLFLCEDKIYIILRYWETWNCKFQVV